MPGECLAASSMKSNCSALCSGCVAHRMSQRTLKLSLVLHAGPSGDWLIQSGWLRAVTLSPKMAMLLYMSFCGGKRLPTSGLTRKTSKSKPGTFFASNRYVPNFMFFYLFSAFTMQIGGRCNKVLHNHSGVRWEAG